MSLSLVLPPPAVRVTQEADARATEAAVLASNSDRASAASAAHTINGQVVRHLAQQQVSAFSLSSANTAGDLPTSVNEQFFQLPAALSLPAVRSIKPQPTFSPIQEWEGYVTAITPTHMIANLVELTPGSDRATLEAEIPLEELSEFDVEKVAVGSVFRWAIGYQRSPSGTKMRGSQIIFRDLPQLTRRELQEAEIEANAMRRYFESAPSEEVDEKS